jgi:hypothetical protein
LRLIGQEVFFYNGVLFGKKGKLLEEKMLPAAGSFIPAAGNAMCGSYE